MKIVRFLRTWLIHAKRDIIVFFISCEEVKVVNFIAKSIASRSMEEKTPGDFALLVNALPLAVCQLLRKFLVVRFLVFSEGF